MKEFIEKEHFAPTCGVVTRRAVVEKTGLFDARLISGGDNEFGNRVCEAGYRLHYTENIILYHPAYKTFKKTVKKHFRVGRGHYQRVYYYPKRYGAICYKLSHPKVYLPPNFFKMIRLFFNTTSSEKERLWFPFIHSLCILCQHYGYLYERFFHRQGNSVGC